MLEAIHLQKTFESEKEALKHWLGVTLSPEQIEMLMEPDKNKVENVELSHLKEEEYVCKYCGKDYNESQSCMRCVNS